MRKPRVRSRWRAAEAPTELPDGAEVEVYPGESDASSSADFIEIELGIDAGLADAAAGRIRDARKVMAELRARR